MGQAGFNRRQFMKAASLGAASVALGGSLNACGSSSQRNESETASSLRDRAAGTSEVVVTMPPSSEPEAGFDPLFAWGCGEHVHEPLIQSTLITTNADMGFEPDVARLWESSEDGLVWTFSLRDDVVFSDGVALTASDVAFTINGINSNDAAQADLSMVEEAVALDDLTVELRLRKPFNAILYTLAVVGIVPQHAYDPNNYGSAPIGSGRYMLEQWDRGQQVILKANPSYYGEAPSMERVIVLFMEEDASVVAAASGQADVCYTAATVAGSVACDGYSLLSCSTVDSRGISLPCIEAGSFRQDQGEQFFAGNDVTCDVSLRRAMNHAVDRQLMIDNVLNGHGSVAYGVSDGMPWHNTDMQVAHDLDKASAIMADGGWMINADGVYEKNGLLASFDCYYSAGDSVRQALVNEFANQMRDFGIKVNPVGSAWTRDPDGIYAHQYSDPVLWGWGSNSPIEMYSLHYGSSSGNYSCCEIAAVDAHFDSALAASTVEESYAEWQAAQWDGAFGFAPQGAASWVWLCNVDHLYFKREGLSVSEQKLHPHGHGWSLVNNVDRWVWE